MLQKIGILLLSILLSIFIASAYGVFHNHFTFSISEEYFTKYKFDQFVFWEGAFGNDSNKKAKIVGILATWWFGAIIGLLYSTAVLFIFRFKSKMKMILIGIALNLGITILFGIIGYAVGILFINDMGMSPEFIESLEDSKSFVIAGSTHNFSYLGACIGIIISLLYLAYKNKQTLQVKN